MNAEQVSRAVATAHQLAATTRDVLAGWVAQNSFTGNVDGCQAMAALLVRDFAPLGWREDRRVGSGGACGDHLAWLSPAWDASAARRVLLIGHHDTVFPPGEFEGYVETQLDQRAIARGPGVLDMKGGFFVVRCALLAMAQAQLLPHVPLALVSVADEETGSRDSAAWLQALATGAAAALVFESGRQRDQVVVARKGTGKVTVTVVGKAAHAGNSLLAGRNAIWALAKVIDAVSGLTNEKTGLSVNVGTVRGGTSANTVPAHAACDIDLRCERPADGEALVAAIRAIARRIAQGSETTIEVAGGFVRTPLVPTPASVALHAAYAAGARAEGLGDAMSPLVGGGSDANTVAAVGVPVIDALGPRGQGFHTPDEYIEIDSLGAKAAALVRYLCGHAPSSLAAG